MLADADFAFWDAWAAAGLEDLGDFVAAAVAGRLHNRATAAVVAAVSRRSVGSRMAGGAGGQSAARMEAERPWAARPSISLKSSMMGADLRRALRLSLTMLVRRWN